MKRVLIAAMFFCLAGTLDVQAATSGEQGFPQFWNDYSGFTKSRSLLFL
jgi:hypothetical protein